NAGARLPKARAVFRGGRAQEVIHLFAFSERGDQVRPALGPRLDEVVAVNGGWDGNLIALGLHELKKPALPEHVLEDDTVRSQGHVALAWFQFLALGVVEVAQQSLVSQGQ